MNRQSQSEIRASETLFEPLEQRTLLSAQLLDNGTLDVFGSRDSETIVAQEVAGAGGQVRLFGVPGVEDATVFEGVRKLRIRMRAGNDLSRIDGTPLDTEGGIMEIRIFGGAGRDQLEIVSTDGRLIGGRGNDTLFGGLGENKLVGGPGADFLAGGGGDDILVGNTGRDRLFGEGGDDLLRGGRANDLLRGGSGNDTLFGGTADDDLFGGSGLDQVSGLAGSDTFRGTFFEWEDFNSEDRFHSDLFDTDPRAVTLPDAFWAEMNAIDAAFDFGIADDVWLAVSAIQHVYAAAPAEVAAFQDALDQLSDDDRDTLGQDALGIFTDFLDGFDDPSDIDSGDLSGLFVDLSGLMSGEVGGAFEALVDAIQGDQDLLESVVLGVQEMATGQFPAEFAALVNDLLFGV